MSAEVVKHRLLLSELARVALLAERDKLLLVGQVEDLRVVAHDLLSEFDDVRAVVTVLRHRPPVCGSSKRCAELIHLSAAVIDVELPRNLRSRCLEDSRDRVADRRPPRVSQMQWAGWVGGDELHVYPLPDECVCLAVRLPGLDDQPGQLALCGRTQCDIEEPWACDIDSFDTRVVCDPGSQDLSDLPRGFASRPGHLERHVGRVVTVLFVLRPLDDHRGRRLDSQLPCVDGRPDGGYDEIGKFSWGHPSKRSDRPPVQGTSLIRPLSLSKLAAQAHCCAAGATSTQQKSGRGASVAARAEAPSPSSIPLR